MNPANGSPTVYVVDDDEDVRRSLARLLRSAGLATRLFASAQELLDEGEDVPGCMVLDLRMPRKSGLDLQSDLAQAGIRMPVIFLTGHGDIPSSVRAMKGGAVDFLTKPFRSSELLAAIKAAIERDQQARQEQAEINSIRERLALLTARELEVFRFVVHGSPNKVIASELGIAERTVKVHRARVMEKMRVVSVAELTRLAGRVQSTPGSSGF